MLAWIIGNGTTIIVSLILLTIVALVIRKLRKDKKRGITSCGTSCSNCAMAGSCKDFRQKYN